MGTTDQPKNKGGRPPGSVSKFTKAAVAEARASGKLPHEILLSIARGDAQELWVPDGKGGLDRKLVGVTLDDRKDAAKACAPYYAPRLNSVETVQGISDDNIDELIRSLAAQTGVALAADGEAEEDEAQDAAARPGQGEPEVRPARRRLL